MKLVSDKFGYGKNKETDFHMLKLIINEVSEMTGFLKEFEETNYSPL